MAPHSVVHSSSASRWYWDAFLSYQGEVTENNFASKLSALLEWAQIKTFKNLEKEEQISAALIKEIKESRFAIIIFSRNYASSRRCLEELALIIECRERFGQKVFPVFLEGVEGSHVRRQTGSFGEPFLLHQECFDPDIVERWRSALRVAGDLCGWNLKDSRNEEKLIHSIVEEVSNALGKVPVDVHQHPVGVNATVDRRTSLLRLPTLTLPMSTEQIRVTLVTGPEENSLDDGYSWRKYGQKVVLGAKYPRSYFRCTHRSTQGCSATKQLQRSDEDPCVFDVTYRGRHTCFQQSF